MSFDHGSRAILTRHDVPRFPSETLFHRVARVVCAAECLPRRELFEAWEVARRAHRRLRGTRVVDLACGHGLIAPLLLLLDRQLEQGLAVDVKLPPSAHTLAAALRERWPDRLAALELREQSLASVAITADDLVVSCHACGALTDRVLDQAIAVGAPVAVLPCCQDATENDTGGLLGWLDVALAVDVTRAARLRAHGYAVHTQIIDETVTRKNRLLLARRQGTARYGIAS